MATTSKVLARTVATTSTATTLYTVPSSTTTVVTNIVIANNSTSATTATMRILTSGTSYPGFTPTLIPTVSIPARSIISIDLKQVMINTEIITGGASLGDEVTFHISGVEIA